MILGLTGNAGSGKTTVAGFFRDMGATIIDCDALGHEVLTQKVVFTQLLKVFGKEILDKSGAIDRSILGEMAFSDDALYNELCTITWPKIRSKINERIAECGSPIVVDAAVLIDAGWHDLVDSVVLVVADEDTRIRRLTNKGVSLSHIENILSNQLHQTELLSHAHYTINNSTTLFDLKVQAQVTWDELMRQEE